MKRLLSVGSLALLLYGCLLPAQFFFRRHQLARERDQLTARLQAVRHQDALTANLLYRLYRQVGAKAIPPRSRQFSFRMTLYSPLGMGKNSTFPPIPAPYYRSGRGLSTTPYPVFRFRWFSWEGKLWRETVFSLPGKSRNRSEPAFLGVAFVVPSEVLAPQNAGIEIRFLTTSPQGVKNLLTKRISLPEAVREISPATLFPVYRYPLRPRFFLVSLLWSLIFAFLVSQAIQPRRRRISKREVQLEEELTYLSKTYQDLAKSLRLEREKVETILNSAPDGIFTCRSDGEIIYWNRSMENLTGIPKENAAGKHYSEILTLFSSSGQSLVDPFAPCLAEGKNLSLLDSRLEIAPAALAIAGFRNFAAAVGAAPIRRMDGALEEIVVTVKNIEEQKEAEHMKKELHAMITHNLRSPLAAILGYAGLIQDPKMWQNESERQRYLESLMRTGKGMLVLIGNLLDWAGAEGGKLSVKKEFFSVKPVLDAVVENLEILGKPKSLVFSVEVEETVLLYSDPDRLKEILLNLVSNAIKFSRQGGNVQLSAKAEGERTAITVSDSGPGIPAEEREKLFEKFSRLRKKGSGTGLGLYIVKALAHALGGSVAVESEENVGSKFTVFLPSVEKGSANQPRQLSLASLEAPAEEMLVIPAKAGIQ